jgi:hypothetical protein
MCPAVHFDHELRSRNIEISDVRPDRMLPENLETEPFAPKLAPKDNLGRAHVAT